MSHIIDTLEPSFKPKIEVLLHELELQGIKCLVTSGRRTIDEQNKLYNQGRTTSGPIVTKAKGGQSPHNFGMAADLCPLTVGNKLWWDAPDDIWHAIAATAEKNGLVAGYHFKSFVDAPHIEDAHWKEQQALWKEGKLQVA